MHEPLATDDLVVEIDGVEPSAIDAEAALDYARSMIRLLTACADPPLVLTGLRIIDKCTAFVTTASDPMAAANAVMEALRALDSANPEQGLGNLVTDVRRSLGALPDHYITGLRVGAFRAEVPRARRPRALLPTSMETFRATPVRVGGARACVRFKSPYEARSFTLDATPDKARRIGAHLYREVEVEAEVMRTTEGDIEGGRVIAFTPISDADDREAWAAWFARNAADSWQDVEE